MTLYCPQCGRAVANRELDLRRGLASCRSCGEAFDFSRRLPPRKGAREAGPPDPASLPPRPPNMRLEEDGSIWRARWRWYDSTYNFLALFSLFWNGVVLFIAISMVARGHFQRLWGLSLHVSIGLVIGYYTLAGFLNITTVEVTRHGLMVRHGPVPWLGNRRLLAHHVEQLYCRQSKVKVNGASRYELHAVWAEGGTVRLVGGMEDADEARFLEQQIEARLGIEPGRVPGEYRD